MNGKASTGEEGETNGRYYREGLTRVAGLAVEQNAKAREG